MKSNNTKGPGNELIDGAKLMLQPAIGLFSWSVVTNLAIIEAGLNQTELVGISLMVYAGTSQLAVMPLIMGNYPIWTIWLVTFIINSRFIIFGASIAPHFSHYKFLPKLFLGYLNADISFLQFTNRYPVPTSEKSTSQILYFYLGASVANWCIWQIGLVFVIIFGSKIPASLGLGFAGILVLIALIVPPIRSKTSLLSALAAGVTCIFTINLPYQLSIVFSVIASVVAAIFIDRIIQKGKHE